MIDYYHIEFAKIDGKTALNDIYKVLTITGLNTIKNAIDYTDKLLTEDITDEFYAEINFYNSDYKCIDVYFLPLDKAELVISKFSNEE